MIRYAFGKDTWAHAWKKNKGTELDKRKIILKTATIYWMLTISPAWVFDLFWNYIYLISALNSNETNTINVPIHRWSWEVKNHFQAKGSQWVVEPGIEHFLILKRELMKIQSGDYYNPLHRTYVIGRLDDWLTDSPSGLNSSNSSHTPFTMFFLSDWRVKPQFTDKSVGGWLLLTLQIWKFLWCSCFWNRHPLDLRKGRKT